MPHQKPDEGARALASPCSETRGQGSAAPETSASPAHCRIAPSAGKERLVSVYPLVGKQNSSSHKLPERPSLGKTASPANRFQSSSGLRQRRVFTAEEKARIVAESFESGQSVCAIARKHRLTASQLFAWRRAARLGRDQGRFESTSTCTLSLQATPVHGKPKPRTGEISPIEITIGTAIVRVWRGADAVTLKEVLRLLSETSQTSSAECLALPGLLGDTKNRGSATERTEKIPNEPGVGDIANGESVPSSGLARKTG
jgi:transposase